MKLKEQKGSRVLEPFFVYDLTKRDLVISNIRTYINISERRGT
ncbi:MAG: hypothetical protein AABY22_14850 [Nanoarchaeota archaeon]